MRVLAATNRDLAARASPRALFRDDLFYRMNTIAIELPPLRERAVDIPLLARQFLAQFGKANPPTLAPDARRRARPYPWPGNVRELAQRDRARRAARAGAADSRERPAAASAGATAPTIAASSLRRSRWPSSSDGTSRPCSTRRTGIRAVPRRRSA